MTDDEAIIRAIVDASRLIYADWLHERGGASCAAKRQALQ